MKKLTDRMPTNNKYKSSHQDIHEHHHHDGLNGTDAKCRKEPSHLYVTFHHTRATVIQLPGI